MFCKIEVEEEEVNSITILQKFTGQIIECIIKITILLKIVSCLKYSGKIRNQDVTLMKGSS